MGDREPPRRSIRGILLGALGLVAVVPFLPFVVLVFVGYGEEVGRVEQEIQATNRQVALLAARYLDGFLATVRDRARQAAEEGGSALPTASDGVRWELVDATGAVVASQIDRGRERHRCGCDEVLRRAAASADPVFFPDRVWWPGGVPTALVAVRLAHPPGGRCLLAALDPAGLHLDPGPDTAETIARREYLVDRTGSLLFSSDPQMALDDRSVRANPPVARFRDGLGGPLRYRSTVTGRERLAFVQPLPSSGAAVIVSADIGSRLIQLRDRYLDLGWSILFAFVAVAGIVAWASRRLLRPVLLIRDALRSEGRREREPLGLRPAELGTTDYVELVGAFDDLERRLAVAEASLLQAEKSALLGQLAAGIAHEFGTPLNVISGNAQLLMRKLDPGDARREVLEKIVRQAQRLAAMIRRVMDFARPVEPQMRPVDLQRVITRALELVAGMIGKTTVEVQVAPDTPQVRGDPALLEHALLNLVVNALQAMPEGGTLRIEAAGEAAGEGEGEPGALLRVTDTGCGIPGDELGKVFEPFFTTKAPDAGTGLGLAIVERIVRQHGGRVEVRSRPGEGATFTIRLRRAVAGGEAEEEQA